MSNYLRFLPEPAKEILRTTRDFVTSRPYRGKARWCPVCEQSSWKFRKYGVVFREDAECPHCKALERHRFTWLYLLKMTDLFDGRNKKMLHIAPEKCFEPRLKRLLKQNYITGDLVNPRAMIKLDITDIPFPDDSFDVIYCSHVLEHVQNDRQAIKEFFRVLKQDGWAILLVPITTDKTFEDPTVTDPAERLRLFGQHDHVRRYGIDYIERLREAGFKVRVHHVADMVEPSDIVRMGLTAESGEIYFCTK